MTYVKVLSQHVFEGLVKPCKTSVRVADFQADSLTQELSDKKRWVE
jgi:hypothetical protein